MLDLQYIFFPLLFLLSPYISLSLGIYAWQNQIRPGVKYFAWMMFACAWWGGCYVIQLLSGTDLTTQIIWNTLRQIGVVSLVPLLVTLVLNYTGREKWLTGSTRLFLWGPSVVMLCLAFTNEFHRLYWSSFQLVESGPFTVLVLERGWLNRLFIIYLNLIGLGTISFLILWIARNHPASHRQQILVVLLGMVLPGVANNLYVTGQTPLDLTSLAFTLTGIGLAGLFINYRLFDIAPVARKFAMEQMLDGLIIVDARHKVIDMNPAAAALFGTSTGEGIGRSASELFHPWPGLLEQLDDPAAPPREIIHEMEHGARKFESRISPLRVPLENLKLIMLRDITQRQQLENARQLAEEKFRLVFENAPVGISLLGANRNLLEANAELEKITGFSKTQLLENRFQKRRYVREDGSPMPATELASVRASAEGTAIHNIVTGIIDEEGQTIWTEASAVPVGSPEGGVIVITRDITKRKQVEEQLRASELRLAEAQSLAHIGSWELDAVTGNVFWSAEMFRLLELSPEQFADDRKQLPHELAKKIHSEDRPTYLAAIESSHAQLLPYDIEFRVQLSNSRVCSYRAQGFPTLGADGKLLKWAGTVMDVTELRLTEHQLRQSEARHRLAINAMDAVPYNLNYMEDRFTFLGEGIERITGYSTVELTTQKWTEIIEEAIMRGKYEGLSLAEAVAQVRQQGDIEGIWRCDFRITTKSGNVCWISDTSVQVQDENGKPVGSIGMFHDITDRRLAEQQIRQSEARYRTIFEAAPVSIWEEDWTAVQAALTGLRTQGVTDFRTYFEQHPEFVQQAANDVEVLNVNPITLKMYGVAEPSELLGSLGKFGAYSQSFLKELTAFAEGQNYYEAEVDEVRLDGAPVNYWLTSKGFTGPDGRFYVFASITDLSARKQIEAQLRERDRQMQALQDNLPNGYSYQLEMAPDDRTGHYIYMSGGIKHLLGIDPVAGLTPTDLIPPFHAEDYHQFMARKAAAINSMTQIEDEARFERRDGQLGWMLLKSTPRRQDNGNIVWDGLALDITDRKRAELALQASDERYGRFFEQTREAIFTFSARTGQLLTANPAFLDLLGYQSSDISGLNLFDFATDEHSKVERHLQELAELGSLDCGDRVWRHKNGQMLDVLVTLSYVSQQDDGIIFGQGLDITGRKQAETALRRQNAYLKAIHMISLNLLNRRDTSELLQTIVDQTAQLIDAEYVSIDLREAEDRLATRAYTANMAFLEGDVMVRGETGFLSWQAVDSGEPVVIPDYSSYDRRRSIYKPISIYASGDVPIMVAGSAIGVLSFMRGRPNRPFTDADIESVQLLAQLSAVALDNARWYSQAQAEITTRQLAEAAARASEAQYRELFGQAERQAKELELLHEVHTAISNELNVEALYKLVVEKVAHVFGYPLVSFYARERSQLILQYQIGYDPVLEQIPIETGIMGRAVQSGQPILIRDVNQVSDFLGIIPDLTSEVAIPILFEGTVGGVLNVEGLRDLHLTDADLKILNEVGEYLSLAITRAHLHSSVLENEERYRDLYENNPLMLFTLDLSGQVLVVNQSVVDQLGYQKTELIGKSVLQVFPRSEWAQVERTLKAFQEEPIQPAPWIFRKVTKAGATLWVSETARLVKDPQGQAVVLIVCEDITARKLAEEALYESRQKYKFLVDHMPAIVFTVGVGPEAPWYYISPQIEQLLGFSAEQWMSNSRLWLQQLHPDDREWVLKREATLASNSDTPQIMELEYRLRKITGEVVWIHEDSTLVWDESLQNMVWQGVMINITQQKLTEEALRESEERFRLIAWAAANAIWDWDLRSDAIWWGGGIQATFRHPTGMGHSDSNWRRALIHPDDRQRVDLTIQQALESDLEFWSKEYRFMRVDGTYADVFDRAYIVRDASGKPQRMMGAMMDITERKRAEEKLRESEERYRAIFESVEDVIYETDHQGILTAVSPSIQNYTGLDPADLIGQHVKTLFVEPSDYEVLDAEIVAQGSLQDYEIHIRGREGEARVGSVNAHVIFSHKGQPLGTRGVARDITQRKQVEERIRQFNIELEQRIAERTAKLNTANSFLEGLLSTALIVNSSLDQDQVLDHILAQARSLIPCRALNIMLIRDQVAYIARRIGYEGLDMIERDLLEYQFPLTWPTFRYMLTTEQSIFIPDTATDPTWQRSDSSAWASSYIGVPLKSGNTIIGFLNASHDQPNFFKLEHITILQGLTEQAATAIGNARLMQELRTALSREQTMRTQLVQADKLVALGKMVAVIAHEINNPIQTVKNSFFLLEHSLPPENHAWDFLKLAQAEVNRIGDLVTQLRDTYRPHTAPATLLDLTEILSEVKGIIQPQLAKSHVRWLQPNSGNHYSSYGLRDNLKQVFLNLGLNAVEAMEPLGGGDLRVDMEPSEDSTQIQVSFSNQGALIPDEQLEHIFEPFFTTKSTGSGLGLSISYDIIQQHHGRISVRNDPVKGVTFTVWLPLAAAQTQE